MHDTDLARMVQDSIAEPSMDKYQSVITEMWTVSHGSIFNKEGVLKHG